MVQMSLFLKAFVFFMWVKLTFPTKAYLTSQIIHYYFKLNLVNWVNVSSELFLCAWSIFLNKRFQLENMESICLPNKWLNFCGVDT